MSELPDLLTGDRGPAFGILIALIIAILITKSRRRSVVQKDPQRMFTAQQRRVGLARASAQCEMQSRWFFRCTRTATHADHFYPHARGGASTMRNLVAACPPHNLSKGARMPSGLDRLLIEHRRTKYFPDAIDRTAGEWFGGTR